MFPEDVGDLNSCECSWTSVLNDSSGRSEAPGARGELWAVLSSALCPSTSLAVGRKQAHSRNETEVVSGLGLFFFKSVENMYIFILGPLEP